ncbi:hypothetical protein E4T52_13908 [Aureobasidium sp. EXF-3400]|nr:hypothetical protein E4T51_13060 [Aureobasidium sp. EXF-12344]KAI4771077.1 hypothetical protein E4T52_13908 [Aureobasidium sp. EXF-3400]
MLTFTALSLLLIPLATAAAIKKPQQLLVQNALTPTIDLANQTAFKRLAIEDMNDVKFRLHHHAVKALLGDQSYLVLRKAEIRQRESEIWNYLWDHELSCDSWPDEDEDDYRFKPKIWLSGGRIFDADPEHVPRAVIDALEELSDNERKKRREIRHQEYCNVNQTDVFQSEKSGKSGLDVVTARPEPRWKVEVPEEYLQYLIPESVLEEEDKASQEAWKVRDEKGKEDILAGRRSVRDMKLPDMSKCQKFNATVWDEEY